MLKCCITQLNWTLPTFYESKVVRIRDVSAKLHHQAQYTLILHALTAKDSSVAIRASNSEVLFQLNVQHGARRLSTSILRDRAFELQSSNRRGNVIIKGTKMLWKQRRPCRMVELFGTRLPLSFDRFLVALVMSLIFITFNIATFWRLIQYFEIVQINYCENSQL